MSFKSIKPILGLILVFMLGAASGSLTTYMVGGGHFDHFSGGDSHRKEDMLLKRLTRQLDLDSRQQEQIKAIVYETHGKIHQVRQKVRPEIETLIQDSQARISVLLNPQQQEVFKKMIEERKSRRDRGHH